MAIKLDTYLPPYIDRSCSHELCQQNVKETQLGSCSSFTYSSKTLDSVARFHNEHCQQAQANASDRVVLNFTVQVKTISTKKTDETQPLRVTDLTQLSLDQIVAPDETTKVFYSLETLEEMKQNNMQRVFECHAAAKSDKALRNLLEKCCDIRTLLPAFSEIGKRLSERLGTTKSNLLLSKHKNCPVTQHHYACFCETKEKFQLFKLSPEGYEEVSKQQMLTLPDIDAWLNQGVNVKKNHALSTVLSELLVERGFDEVEPRTLLNYVPSVLANIIAKKYLYREDSETSTFAHGEYSHFVQIIALAMCGALDKEVLAKLVDNGLWAPFIDRKSHSVTSQVLTGQSTDKLHLYQGVTSSLTLNSPHNIVFILLQKKLSEAVKNIQSSNDIARQKVFLESFGIPTDDAISIPASLKKLHEHCAILEACMIDTAYKSYRRGGGMQLPELTLTNLAFLASKDTKNKSFDIAINYCKKQRQVIVIVEDYKKVAKGMKTTIEQNIAEIITVTSDKELEKIKSRVCADDSKLVSFVINPKGVDHTFTAQEIADATKPITPPNTPPQTTSQPKCCCIIL